MTFIKTYFTSLLFVLGIININAQTTNNELKKRIENIITGKKADVGVSIIGGNKNDKVQINGNQLYPMLSTFKFPIALTVLHKVEKGELKMSQKIFIKKKSYWTTHGVLFWKNIPRKYFNHSGRCTHVDDVL